MNNIPLRDDNIYNEIEKLNDYEFRNCIVFEMIIRTSKMKEFKEFALRDKQIKEVAKWTNEKVKETYIKINGEYRDCDFLNNWLKK